MHEARKSVQWLGRAHKSSEECVKAQKSARGSEECAMARKVVQRCCEVRGNVQLGGFLF